MNLYLPVLRARLELDQTLRTRAFFARAVNGRLEGDEYRELVAQWTHLACSVVADPGDLLALAQRDVGSIDALTPCASVVLARGYVMSLEQELVGLSTLSLMGTSWIGEAIESGRRRGLSCALLEEIAKRSTQAKTILQQRTEARTFDAHAVYAFVEALRGIVLGVAAHLDATWPPPMAYVKLDLN